MADAEARGTQPGNTGCSTCGREMVEWQDADGSDDPRINCGGDCLWCQYGFEIDFPEEYRCTKPRGWTITADGRATWTLRERRAAYDLLRTTGLSRFDSLRVLFGIDSR